jgi:hypothetical protein
MCKQLLDQWADKLFYLHHLIRETLLERLSIIDLLAKRTSWNPEDDPWTERAQRGGFFLLFWTLPFVAAYLWRLYDSSVPFPGEVFMG